MADRRLDARLILAGVPLLCVTASCGRDVPDPPTRASPELVEIALPGSYFGDDPRSGALLLRDDEAGVSRVYAWRGDALEAVSPELDTRDVYATLRAFPGGAWVAHDDVIARTNGTTWETFGAEVCGGLEGESFVFIDAASADEAWATVTSAPTMELCHFDGAAWTREPIDFLFTQGAVVGDRLLAFHDDIVAERPIEGGAPGSSCSRETASACSRTAASS